MGKKEKKTKQSKQPKETEHAIVEEEEESLRGMRGRNPEFTQGGSRFRSDWEGDRKRRSAASYASR